MAVGIDVGLDRDGLPDDALDGERTAIDARRDLLDDDPRRLRHVDEQTSVAARAFDDRLRARDDHDANFAGLKRRGRIVAAEHARAAERRDTLLDRVEMNRDWVRL